MLAKILIRVFKEAVYFVLIMIMVILGILAAVSIEIGFNGLAIVAIAFGIWDLVTMIRVSRINR